MLGSDEGKTFSKETGKSPELSHRMSRAETVRHDARKLKTATLNRMGKMFKQRSQTPVTDKSFLGVNDGAVSDLMSLRCTRIEILQIFVIACDYFAHTKIMFIEKIIYQK